MRLDTIHSLIIVAMVALATQITRWTPFLLFSGDKKLPKVVEDLGRLLPPAMMGLLVVYSLRSIDLMGGSHGIPEAIAVAVTAGLHLWRRKAPSLGTALSYFPVNGAHYSQCYVCEVRIMDVKRLSRQTCRFLQPPGVVSFAAVAGKLEGEGPLGGCFDAVGTDAFCGKKTWEQGEAQMQADALRLALQKGGLAAEDVDCAFAGDLLNQNIGATFALRDFNIPFYGVYGACSTMGETLSLAAMAVASGAVRMAAAQTSSHFCTAERQYRMPLPYGSQRSPTAQWTATAAGCCILGAQAEGPYITHVTRGRIVDLGVTDMTNMGAAMAPAAFDTLQAVFRDTGTAPGDYDLILTGDLGDVGSRIVLELFAREGVALENYTDCGLLLYDRKRQDMHAGGRRCAGAGGGGCCSPPPGRC